MNTVIKTTLTRKHTDKLNRLALRYGLSLSDFVTRVLAEMSDDIPEELISDYASPRTLRTSIKRGLADWKSGRVSTQL